MSLERSGWHGGRVACVTLLSSTFHMLVCFFILSCLLLNLSFLKGACRGHAAEEGLIFSGRKLQS